MPPRPASRIVIGKTIFLLHLTMPVLHADIAVIGGGMAGLPMANKVAYKGNKTVLLERELLGGTCLNRGCIPTKTMIEAARVAYTVRKANQFGITTSPPAVNLPAIIEHRNTVVETIRRSAYKQVADNKNLTLIEAQATFEAPHRLRAGDIRVEAERIVINTGARPSIPAIEGLADVPYHTSRSLLEVTTIPRKLLILGGGYVACEFAQMFARFGSSVTVIQKAPRLLNHEDAEISEIIAAAFRDEGIDILVDSLVTHVENTGGGIGLCLHKAGDRLSVTGDLLLVATGRRPNTEALDLMLAGIETDSAGFIIVDETYRTTQNGVWAIGDVTGAPMFTHSARDDADRLYRHFVKGESPSSTGRHVPYAIFTDPEIAAVGLTEHQARNQGYTVKLGKHPFKRVARARAMGALSGFVKIVADAKTDRLLGAQIIGPHAGDLIHELVIALDLKASYQQLRRSLHVHPTLAEGINSAVGGVHRPAGDR